MPSKGDLTKARLTESMLELIQSNGYSGTGLNAITEHATAPKGSVYFHFPDGKEGLGIAAVELASKQFEALIVQAAATEGSAAGTAQVVIETLAAIVSESDYRLGCPVSVVTLEMGAESEKLRSACASAFESWIGPTAALLESEGLEQATARSLATVVVSTIEGAVIVSRAMRNTQALMSAAEVVAELINSRTSSGASNTGGNDDNIGGNASNTPTK
ncbi:TetR/AcrR family transcriptional regulator [Leucobacter sp. UT-8R-CII-1-4]|uniref:TetR/AcrR family transcriptional regulator n=1 Tax=Leucobacter sp. UT-8R-CII-1-4 TaxID=3040075 RepID=UPI0024A7FB17|nr:TetR/AcrR family transcriptional regulator [Leucobacter sp. UT-8R-CII-1-4]MDI6023190.1 TetR/AcrR family transcriptional regulator [Leucobacter sp. UT-8R-CII-1-4]